MLEGKGDMRSKVDACLPAQAIANLHAEFSVETDLSAFRERLVHILTRFERGRAVSALPPKKVQRLQLSKFEKAASQLNQFPEEFRDYIFESLAVQMELDTFDDWTESHDFWSEDGPADTPSSQEIMMFMDRIHRASKQLLVNLDMKSGLDEYDKAEVGKGPTWTPLDQLITDIEGTIYGLESSENSSACYYDAVSESYRGHLFEFTKKLLDVYDSKSYFSDVALGKRITRVLKKDK